MRRFASLLLALLLPLCLALPAAAAETEQFVFDQAGILTAEEVEELETAAAEVSDQYNCGIYVFTVADMGADGFYDIEEYAEWVYESWDLGYDQENTGLMLILSMAERDYDLDAFGDRAHRAFTDYGKESLADTFLDDFRLDDWAGGFRDYIDNAGALLERAANGTPLDVPQYDPGYGPAPGVSDVYREPVFYRERTLSDKLKTAALPGLAVGVIAAVIYCSVLRMKMRSAKPAREASGYMARNGVDLRIREDRFTHSTQVRHHIDRNPGGGAGSHGGGTHISSGGHSHHSGKF